MQPSQQKRPKPTWLRSRIASFRYAFVGIAVLFNTQLHAKIHALATILVVLLGWYFQLTVYEWIAITCVIGLVWVAEAFNTALEFLVDLVHPQWNTDAGRIKDLAAGAVLLAAITALLVGAFIFIPYLMGS